MKHIFIQLIKICIFLTKKVTFSSSPEMGPKEHNIRFNVTE